MRLASRLIAGLVLAGILAGCGGLNRAVTVFPNALDDLAAKRDPDRRPEGRAPASPPARL
ncbi:hypothetical protein [Antarcticirhabdus aurantiaca]|uniref:Uncharacterized protein n=1 Tax=Antarcticirhabdus aurantiaca TaxID=2606717 RepID=A0ACD4NIF1_9HYPH|nr:hypothetical protein [Antarcticirhabdus aurantiaca]WAJ26565.1 hypothetical protein OXU80_16990 [Jeongeuplla avenae]